MSLKVIHVVIFVGGAFSLDTSIIIIELKSGHEDVCGCLLNTNTECNY